MKKIILITIGLMPFVSLAQKSFQISGKIVHLKSPAKAYLRYQTDAGVPVSDSIEVSDGKFNFKGSVTSVLPATLTLKHGSGFLDKSDKDIFSFFLENYEMNLSATDSVKYANLQGSPTSDDNKNLELTLKPVIDEITALHAAWYGKGKQPDNPAYVKDLERLKQLAAQRNTLSVKFTEDHPNSYIALRLFIQSNLTAPDFSADIVQPKFDRFSPEIKTSPLGKKVEELIAHNRNRSLGTIMSFTQNDVNGKPVKLSDYKGKYVLIDFWASWCAPCRAENPNVLKAYHALKNKNFEIIGISLDDNKQKWLDAIKKDGLPWVQVSELKGFKSEVAVDYAINSIPQNVLVDPDGKIIAKSLRGDNLLSQLTAFIK